ncbi:hypothetical protein F5X97DRAFT_155169 [Nemania serpens]|nr:hypothetical protein F5X97DRAFT_155169 [Nemania serpens]
MLSASYVHLFDLLVATLSQAPSSYVTITRAEVIHHPVQTLPPNVNVLDPSPYLHLDLHYLRLRPLLRLARQPQNLHTTISIRISSP